MEEKKKAVTKQAYITKMTYVLPVNIEENVDCRLLRKTGIRHRHICPMEKTASDMAQEAAEKLFSSNIPRDSIDFLLFCTQSPDYPLPSTACLLQNKLRIPQSAGALDFNLGCSGFVYGLGLAKGLIETGQAERVLLLTGETYSKYIHPEDYSTRSVFGDGATATLIQSVEKSEQGIHDFVYGSDGSGAGQLIVPVGGMRHRFMDTDVTVTEDEHGNKRTNRNVYMDGMAIVDFAMRVVPKMVDQILTKAALRREDINYYVFHQANRFMLTYLRQKCGLIEFPYWEDVSEYGNTVSNSIPIALVDLLRRHRELSLEKVMIIGFGVGLSWGGCIVNLSNARET